MYVTVGLGHYNFSVLRSDQVGFHLEHDYLVRN